jgi:hypothetical protein
MIDIHDYASTTKNKTVRQFTGTDTNSSASGAFRLGLGSGLWMSSSAITTVSILPGGTAHAAGTTFALYGIKG